MTRTPHVTTFALEGAGTSATAAATAVGHALTRGAPDPRDAGEEYTAAARRWGLWVERALRVGADEPVSDWRARQMARSAAIVVHCACQRAYAEGGVAVAEPAAALAREERAFLTALSTLRSAAVAGAVTPALVHLWHRISEPATLPVTAIAATVGAMSDADRRAGAIGLRTSLLARRSAMLAAGVANLHRRLLDPRLRRGVAGIAGRRETLSRLRPEPRLARRTLAGAAPLSRLEVRGVVTETGWVDRPGIPYSYATTERFQVRVHRRDVSDVGIAAGRELWVRGKVEEEDGTPVLVAEFEGPGTHAGTVWEDWTADEVRDSYDLWPLVVDMVAELPAPGRRGGAADLLARIAEPIES